MGNMVKSESYGVEKHILIANDSYMVTLPAQVGNTGVTAVGGKKILKAGTPLAGNIEERGTAFVKATGGESANATAVLLHDVDVTDGNNNATIVLAGVVDLLKLEDDVKTLLDANTKKALNRIIFVKGSAV